MGSFGSLAAFAAHLTALTVRIDQARQDALEEAAQVVETEARSYPGDYQAGWPALKPETVARKAAGDSPLLETGKMRDSYGHQIISDREAVVGSNDENALRHELGTSKMPPRPVLTTAAVAKEDEVRQILGRRTVAALIGRGT